MEAKQKITLDFVGYGATPLIHVMQGDTGTRVLEIDLYAAGVAWEIPSGMDIALRYRKPDGTQGLYTELPDGSAAAVVDTTNKNRVTLTLAPQVTTVAGDVIASIVITDTASVLASFPVVVRVHADPAAEPTESTDYYKYGTLAGINQALESLEESSGRAVYKVNGVEPDANGNVNTPGAGTGGEVVSVNGKNGQVTLTAADVGAMPAATTGTDENWAWIKYADGRAECWALFTHSSVVVNTAWGSVYESADSYGNTAYPEGLFVAEPVVSIMVAGVQASTLSAEISGGSATACPVWHYVRPTASTNANNYKAHVVARGRWK